MAYLGNDLQVAFPSYRIIDDISSGFNGTQTSFALTVSGSTPVPFPINPQQCLLSVNGVIQKPDPTGSSGFNLVGSNIVFASAPTGGWSFFGVILAGADYVNVGANFPSGSAAAPSITFDSDTDTGVYNSGANQVSITTSGVERLRIDSAGQIESVSLGTAASPAFSWTTDPNTGIYSPGADQVAISTAGTGRLFVDASGNVALSGNGTGPRYLALLNETNTYAGSYVLQAGGGSAGFGGAITMYGHSHASYPGSVYIGTSSGSGGSIILGTNNAIDPSGGEKVRITSAGLVGIGNSAPTRLLEAHGAPASVGSDGTGVLASFVNNSTAFNASPTAAISLWTRFNSGGATFPSAVLQAGKENATDGNFAGYISLQTTTAAGNSTERLRIDSSGRVGIGTTSPGAPLEVNVPSVTTGYNVNFRVSRNAATGYGSTDFAQYYNSLSDFGFNLSIGATNETNGRAGITLSSNVSGSGDIRLITSGSERARIDSSGRLLVGTSTARSWSGITGQLQLEGTSTNASAATFTANINGADGSYLTFIKSRGTTLGSNTVVSSGDILGGLYFAGADGTQPIQAAVIQAVVDGTPGTNDMPGRLVFATTADGASSPTERMRITNAGRVGISQTAPATTFDLSGAYSTNIVAIAALDIDCSLGNYFTKTINGNSTFTVSNVPSGRSYAFTLELTHTSGTITWFSGVEWPGGAAPTLTTGKTHLFMFVTDDGGSRWRASSLINYTT